MNRVILIFCTLLFTSLELFASSALFIKRDLMIMGKNFDSFNGEGLVIKNNRGVKKTAYEIDLPNVVSWTSKYGSVTFNQVGKEFPYGGINERGLAIEMLQLPGSQYKENGQASLSELEWIQYQLDNYKTAAEVEANINSLSINPLSESVHYFIVDRGGRSFVLEFLNGKAMISHTQNEYQAVTNSAYQASMAYFEKNKNSVSYDSRESKDRFCQLMSQVDSRNAKSLGGVLRILAESKVNENDYKTYWTIVYDLKNLQLVFKTHDDQTIKLVELKTIDFSRYSPVLGMDINTKQIYWKYYDEEMNLALLESTLKRNNVKLNTETANQHMLNPSLALKDDMYSKYHQDLTVKFTVKKTEGVLFYTLTEGQEHYELVENSTGEMLDVNNSKLEITLYSLPINEYVLSCFHDLNGNSERDKGFLGIGTEPIVFSNNRKSCFSFMPDYEKVKFNSKSNKKLQITLK